VATQRARPGDPEVVIEKVLVETTTHLSKWRRYQPSGRVRLRVEANEGTELARKLFHFAEHWECEHKRIIKLTCKRPVGVVRLCRDCNEVVEWKPRKSNG